jgi:hypothetical protein
MISDKEKLQQIADALYKIRSMLSSKANVTEDATFSFDNAEIHYKKHMALGELPKSMTVREYMNKARDVSLKNIDGNNVRAYKADGRIKKFDGSWFVVYNGNAIATAYPLRGGTRRFEELMRKESGKEI